MTTGQFEPTPGQVWWLRLNKIAAAAVVVVLSLNIGHAYVWFVGRGVLAPLAVVLGLPALVYVAFLWHSEHREVLVVWAIAGGIVLLFVARTATLDAHQLHYANCWKIRGNDSSSVWECAPGRSEPTHWAPSYNPNTDEDTPGRYCDYLNDTSSGGTIWHCSSS